MAILLMMALRFRRPRRPGAQQPTFGRRLHSAHRLRCRRGRAPRWSRRCCAIPTARTCPSPCSTTTPSKRHLSIMGVPVVGGPQRHRRGDACATASDNLLIAIRCGTGALHRELSRPRRRCRPAGERRPLAPRGGRGVGRGCSTSARCTWKTCSEAREMHTDLVAAASYLRARRVLVTGAGGSIGSELCRQIHRFKPAELIMVDRDESALHALQLSIEGRALLDAPNLVLLDIRDRTGSRLLFVRAPARRGLPRRRPQAPPDARAAPRRGGQDEHLGHAQRARGVGAARGRPLRERLDRQGGRSVLGARILEADLRAPHGRRLGPHAPAAPT